MRIALTKFECVEDTRGPGNDEPYAIVFAVDTAAIPSLISAVSGGVAGLARTTLYGPLGGMTAGDAKGVDDPPFCWGFDDRPRALNAPLDALILVAVMESDNDYNFANQVRSLTHGITLGSFLGYVGMDRNPLVQNLLLDMQGALDAGKSGGLERDERLGAVQELQLTQADLDAARNVVVEKSLTFVSEEQASEYIVTFRMSSFLSVRSVANGCGISAPLSWIQDISGKSVREKLLSMERTCV